MGKHDASAQMIGYLYQVEAALYFLLKERDEEAKVCIEKFDDISFNDRNEAPERQLQIKHHSKPADLADRSVDLWRTLNVWIDNINHNPSLLGTCRFFIITTASVPDDSIVCDIIRKSSPDAIYSKLFEIANDSDNRKTNVPYYNAFISFPEESAKKLIESITIEPDSPNIQELSEEIKLLIKYATLPHFENEVLSRIKGWWFEKSIECLCSETPIFITQSQIRSKIFDISSEYGEDNLPIDVSDKEIAALKKSADVTILLNQLKFIGSGTHRIERAMTDYYKACTQRSKWVREDVCLVDELDKYEDRLYDEWQFAYSEIQDKIDNNTSEDEKRNYGNALYSRTMDKDIRIRSKVNSAFVMRGSYHNMANNKRIGWHPEFQKLLEALALLEDHK